MLVIFIIMNIETNTHDSALSPNCLFFSHWLRSEPPKQHAMRRQRQQKVPMREKKSKVWMGGRVPFHLPLCYYGHVYESAGVIRLPPKPTQCQNASSKQKAAEAGRQPICNMMPPMISEFKYITSFPCVRTPLAKPEEWNATLARELIFPFSSNLLLYKQGDKQAREQHQLGVWRRRQVSSFWRPWWDTCAYRWARKHQLIANTCQTLHT